MKRVIFLITCLIFVTMTMATAMGHGNYIKSNILKELKDGDKLAIVLMHFGTTHDDTRKKTIEAINEEVRKEFPNIDVFEAYTSRIVIKRLNDRGMHYPNPDELLHDLAKKGYTHIIIQPSTIIDGVEMSSIHYNTDIIRPLFKEIRLSEPLLFHTKDYEHLIKNITENRSDKEYYVLVGHGTYDVSTAQYCMLDYMMRDQGYKNFVVGTIEGYPEFDHVVKYLKKHDAKHVTLVPLMIVAGEHARNDIKEDWKEDLEKLGFEVAVDLRGLGEYESIRKQFCKKIDFTINYKRRTINEKKKIYKKTGEKL